MNLPKLLLHLQICDFFSKVIYLYSTFLSTRQLTVLVEVHFGFHPSSTSY